MRDIMNHQSAGILLMESFWKDSEIAVVFLLLLTDVTEMEFGSCYLSVMDEHYNLLRETGRWQSNLRTAFWNWPISQICAMAIRDNIFSYELFLSQQQGNDLFPA